MDELLKYLAGMVAQNIGKLTRRLHEHPELEERPAFQIWSETAQKPPKPPKKPPAKPTTPPPNSGNVEGS